MSVAFPVLRAVRNMADVTVNFNNLINYFKALQKEQSAPSAGLTGRFTMDAANAKNVSNTHVTGNCLVKIYPLNVQAGSLQGSSSALVHQMSSNNPGVGFVVATSSGAAAAGTEQFYYEIVIP